MLNQLPKLLGRDFVFGFLLPATLFAFASYCLFEHCGWVDGSHIAHLQEDNPWFAASGATVAIGLTALVLMLVNRPLIRLKEGYGLLIHVWNPFMAYQEWRWKRLHRAIERVDDQIDAAGENASRSLIARQIQLHGSAANEFPSQSSSLLPTAFGNVVRAFEVYPKTMYGFEAIAGWPRLLTVIPKDFREQVDSARGLVDLWVNAWALSLIFATQTIAIHHVSPNFAAAPIVATALAFAWLSSRRARFAALQWGELVKAACDVFLPALAEKLKLNDEETANQPSWQGFSQAITYRDPGALAADPSGDDLSTEERDAKCDVSRSVSRFVGALLIFELLRRAVRQT